MGRHLQANDGDTYLGFWYALSNCLTEGGWRVRVQEKAVKDPKRPSIDPRARIWSIYNKSKVTSQMQGLWYIREICHLHHLFKGRRKKTFYRTKSYIGDCCLSLSTKFFESLVYLGTSFINFYFLFHCLALCC